RAEREDGDGPPGAGRDVRRRVRPVPRRDDAGPREHGDRLGGGICLPPEGAPMRLSARDWVLVLAGQACLLAPPLMLAGVHTPVRVVATLLLLGLAPGAAALPLLGPRGARVDLILVVAASLAFCAVTAQMMLWLHAWD